MHRSSSKSISKGSLLRRSLCALLVGASLFAARASNAQTTIFQNVNTSNELQYYPNGEGEDYNALYAFTTIGTGSTRLNNWKVSSLEISLIDNNTGAIFVPDEDQILVTFYSNMNVAATGSTVVNNTTLFQGQIYSGTSPLNPLYYGDNTITAASTGGLFYLPNATNATTYGIQISILDSAGTAFDTNIHPGFTYATTVGSNPGSSTWENTNNDNPDTYVGSNALPTCVGGTGPTCTGGDDYNLFLQLNATAVPAPSALTVLALGATPLLGLLRRRRK